MSAFSGLDRSFWAHVRLVSERIGYSRRAGILKRKSLRRYEMADVVRCLKDASLSTDHLRGMSRKRIPYGDMICSYLNQRAELLEEKVSRWFMDRTEARKTFMALRSSIRPACYLPMNKQRGEKRHEAYLVGIVNMLTEQALGGVHFEDNPRGLTVVTAGGRPLRVLARWMDGAFPSPIDPYAVWEVKEYYGTTTFGSRVADGVYETMLDGEELAELESREGRKIRHYLIVDDRFTWWECGRSYLCRIMDMLHMGLVDEVIFGKEVLDRWPAIVKGWPRR